MTYCERLMAHAEKVKRCVDAARNGEKYWIIAERECVWETQISRWACKAGIVRGSGRRKGRTLFVQSRIRAIRYLKLSLGWNGPKIAKHLGISSQRVYQLFKLMDEKTS